MTLDEYLGRLPAGAPARFARQLRVTQATVSMWRAGTKRPSPENALAIERATFGAVPCEVTRPDIDWAVVRGAAKVAA